MLLSSLARTNLDVAGSQFTWLQLSYSTADIEQSIFYGPESSPAELGGAVEETAILVVHGEMYVLEEGDIPQPSIPLTKESGLFRIVGLAN